MNDILHQLPLRLKSTHNDTQNELRSLKSKYKFLEIDHDNLKDTHGKLWLKIKRDTFMIESKEEIELLNDEIERLRFENKNLVKEYNSLLEDMKKFGEMCKAESEKLRNDLKNRCN